MDLLPRVDERFVPLLCVCYKHFTFGRIFILRPRLYILHKISRFIPLRQIYLLRLQCCWDLDIFFRLSPILTPYCVNSEKCIITMTHDAYHTMMKHLYWRIVVFTLLKGLQFHFSPTQEIDSLVASQLLVCRKTT